MTEKVRKMPCPRCGTETVYSAENKWRPFCSERCQLIDLGKWASDEYRVAEEKLQEEKKPGSDPDSSPNSNSL